MLLCVWRIALAVTTPLRAFVSVVLTALVAYHGLRGIMANHNTLQLLPVQGCCCGRCWARCARHRKGPRAGGCGPPPGPRARCACCPNTALWCGISPWPGCGAAGAAHAQPARLGASAAERRCVPGAAGAHVAWMAQSDFATRYAQDSFENSSPSSAGLPGYWADGSLLPPLSWCPGAALIALGVLRWRLRRCRRAAAPMASACSSTCWALARCCSRCAWAWAACLASSWATTFVLAGLLLLRWVPAVTPARLLGDHAGRGAADGHLLLAGGLALGRGVLVDQAGAQCPLNFPAPAMAHALQAVWASTRRCACWLARPGWRATCRSTCRPSPWCSSTPSRATRLDRHRRATALRPAGGGGAQPRRPHRARRRCSSWHAPAPTASSACRGPPSHKGHN